LLLQLTEIGNLVQTVGNDSLDIPGQGKLLEGEDRFQDQFLFALQGGVGLVDA
jgi:hypothetical protein